MINRTFRFFLLNLIAVLLVITCASNTTTDGGAAKSQGPGQELLDDLNAAMTRAQNGREAAQAVQAQVYFPDEWNKAETDNNAGKGANKNTVEGVRQGIAQFTSAAEGYEVIAANAGPLFAKDQTDANSALQAAMARAEKSRKDAQDNQAPNNFPDEWAGAETERQNGLDAKKDTITEMKAAAALFVSAADSYDAIAGKSKQILAKEKEDADKALQAALANAEKSRQAAMAVNGQTYFPNDWRDAEAKNTSGKNARKTTTDEVKAATALFVSATAAYDDITAKSQQRYARDLDDANKALQAAVTRADRSRQAAVGAEAQTYLANDWRSAETKNTSARNARKTTLDEIKAATALYVSAADAYDDVARRSQQLAAKDKEDSNRALLAAIERAEKSRKDAQDAKANVNLPADWNNAETKNRTATNARRGTTAEMKAATPLYIAAADAYDDLLRKNTAFLSAQNQQPAEDAKARAERERQKALDVRADIAVVAEFGSADAIFRQAAADFDKKAFTQAIESYDKSADQFIAAALLAERKRALADDSIGEAKQRSAQSSDFAVNTGVAMEAKDETI
jgi:hypothetical protein